jgi:hypothetical protein
MNYGLIPRALSATGTVTRDPAQTDEIADGFVDSSVARFLNRKVPEDGTDSHV